MEKLKVQLIKLKLFMILNKANLKIMVLIILGLLLAVIALWCLLSPSSSPQKVQEEITSLSSEIRQFYKNRPGYWGLSTQTALKNGIVPNAMQKDNKITNFLDKEVLVGHGNNGMIIMPGSHSFDIVYKDLTKKECINFASINFSNEISLGLLEITIQNTTKSQKFSWGNDRALPITKTEAKKWCEDSSVIIWSFE